MSTRIVTFGEILACCIYAHGKPIEYVFKCHPLALANGKFDFSKVFPCNSHSQGGDDKQAS